MAWVDVAGDVDGTTFRFGMILPTNTLGPLIASYLTERPTELNTCSIPCPGPREYRGFFFRVGAMVLCMRWQGLLCVIIGPRALSNPSLQLPGGLPGQAL